MKPQILIDDPVNAVVELFRSTSEGRALCAAMLEASKAKAALDARIERVRKESAEGLADAAAREHVRQCHAAFQAIILPKS